jgi:hypothetical protein
MSLSTGISRFGRVAIAAGMVGMLAAGLGAPAASHAAPALLKATGRDFTVVSIGGSTTSTTMMVQRGPDSPEISVIINPTTTLVRRFNGPAELSQFSAGDRVHITGTGTAATTITATEVKDNSIQVAFTQINGRVLFVSRALDRMVLRVTANQGSNAAIPVGNIATLNITPTTPVDLLGQHNGTVANVRPGMVLTLWGLSNRPGQIVFRPHDITQLLTNNANVLTKSAPGDNTPD